MCLQQSERPTIPASVPGKWVDGNACSSMCLLIMNDKWPCSGSSVCGARQRPLLPAAIYSEHVAPFLRFGGPLTNMLYAIGGRNRRRGPVDSVEMLDTWHGCWVPCPSMPRRRAGCAAVALPDGRLIVIGGYDERGIAQGLLSTCDVYDPYSERWIENGSAPLQRARWGHGCAVLGDQVYAVGGCSLQHQAAPQPAFMETLRCCEVYDPKADKWKECSSLQVARSGCRVVALGDRRLAAVGGCDDVFGRAETQATVEIYDAATGFWELLSTRLAQPRTSAAVAALDDSRFFVAGGAPSQLSVEVYCTPPSAKTAVHALASSTNMGISSTSQPLEDASDGSDGEANNYFGELSVDDMLEGRMGCQAQVVRLPGPKNNFPICDRECVLIVGGERCDKGTEHLAMPRVNQLCTVAAYDLNAGVWRDESSVPSMAVARTTVALCVGVGHVSTARHRSTLPSSIGGG